MTGFRTRPNLSDLQFRQIPGTTLNLSGTTVFTEPSVLKLLHPPVNADNGEDPFLRTTSDGVVYKQYIDFDGLGTDIIWTQIMVPYDEETTLFDLSELSNHGANEITSNYLKITTLFGNSENSKDITMGGTVSSEFIIHRDRDNGYHSSEIKTQHAGIFCKYNDETDVRFVTAGDVIIYMENSKIYIKQKIGGGFLSEHNEYYGKISFDEPYPELKCDFKLEIREMVI